VATETAGFAESRCRFPDVRTALRFETLVWILAQVGRTKGGYASLCRGVPPVRRMVRAGVSGMMQREMAKLKTLEGQLVSVALMGRLPG